MWGTSSPDDKLTGDLGNVIETVKNGGRGSDRLMARKLSPSNFGLLQQYLPGPDSCSAASSIGKSEVEDAVPEHKFLALRKTIDGGNEPQEELIVGFDGGTGALGVVIHDILLIKKMGASPPNPQETK
jgi:hypothetical protein